MKWQGVAPLCLFMETYLQVRWLSIKASFTSLFVFPGSLSCMTLNFTWQHQVPTIRSEISTVNFKEGKSRTRLSVNRFVRDQILVYHQADNGYIIKEYDSKQTHQIFYFRNERSRVLNPVYLDEWHHCNYSLLYMAIDFSKMSNGQFRI